MNEYIVEKFLNSNRETLAAHAGSLLFFSWAELALREGTDADTILFRVMTYNIEGIKEERYE